ncbi:MAG: hypothetical protein ABJN69_14110 [Hellea sp.]
MAKFPVLEKLELKGLSVGAPQILGHIRIVPILRPSFKTKPSKLRMGIQNYDAPYGIVDTGDAYYASTYMPHGLIATWEDGNPVATYGASFTKTSSKNVNARQHQGRKHKSQIFTRMAKQVDKSALRLLPRHMAMEGFLSMYFKGPEIAWSEYSREVFKQGLSVRSETGLGREYFSGIDAALKTFEIHEAQVGAVLFIADVMADILVLSHPDDYKNLHKSLIADYFAMEFQYLREDSISQQGWVKLRGAKDLDDLELAVKELQTAWGESQAWMTQGLIDRDIKSTRIYSAHDFSLQSFITDYKASFDDNFIGEIITNKEGDVEYLKAFALSKAQTKRVFLLDLLAEHSWNIEAAARAAGQDYDAFVLRMEKAGFGYILRPHVIQDARRRAKCKAL